MKKIVMMEYNTTRSNLILREYGRNFHKLVEYVGNVKDKEQRNKMSKTLVEMMKITQPSFKDQSEVEAKMWDDLYIMSDYSLDIDSPYPKPKRKVNLIYQKNFIIQNQKLDIDTMERKSNY